MNSWDDLAIALQREAEQIFHTTGEVIVVAPIDASASGLILVSQTHSLKITHIVEKNVIRWETENEYAFERIPEQTTSLARVLMRQLRR